MHWCQHCQVPHSSVSCYSPTNPWGGALRAPGTPLPPPAPPSALQVLVDGIHALGGTLLILHDEFILDVPSEHQAEASALMKAYTRARAASDMKLAMAVADLAYLQAGVLSAEAIRSRWIPPQGTKEDIISAACMSEDGAVISRANVAVLECDPAVIVVVIKRAHRWTTTPDEYPDEVQSQIYVDPEPLLAGVRERVMEHLAVGFRLVVTSGPCWSSPTELSGIYRGIPLRLMSSAAIADAMVMVDAQLGRSNNERAQIALGGWTQRFLAELERRHTAGEPEFEFPTPAYDLVKILGAAQVRAA